MVKLIDIDEMKRFLFKVRQEREYKFWQLKEMSRLTVGILGEEVDLELVVVYRFTQKKWLMGKFRCSEGKLNFLFEVSLYCLGYEGKLHQRAKQVGEEIINLYNKSNMKRSG